MAVDVERNLARVSSDEVGPVPGFWAQQLTASGTFASEPRRMLAVLDAAVRCVENSRLTADPVHWLFDDATHSPRAAEPSRPYPFEPTCALLELDASPVRHRRRLAPGVTPARPTQAAGNAQERSGAIGIREPRRARAPRTRSG